ncbi:hypothetical protein AN8826.2 [Aspergillus nidulans FGSC A4]|uniref:AT DNA binding protein, putative (AFU_orthologue AFUA_5G05990) n=1 Tax=Emericella nidulans (strain FGSC A4 / ATCC 38163 / CBS 112.46 / NRRL 194 / M139) TaxID=227321 RepID=Q5ASA4_EMENI|nr:hypothetical protein [Aspergillus nidulans FGSC A4]EAA60114.1 hypothetical protein AN8826.2 [Aspergillus nidulans FGSC A4]CBF77938.1 TPA: AT DNA binding protein, putative (AFU_orthologue; AFUA_5G05990) [Aspergillus nidulans FGSC A4]|eukprot:XP_682095.1 hypothetical protein AN8826.2 [Aspergillus nidulans FGSC A4]
MSHSREKTWTEDEKSVFHEMCQELASQVNTRFGPIHPPRHPAPAQSVPLPDSNNSARKRPLYPTDKPILAPRAIQPRPPAGPASYSSESGASTMLSPGTGDVPGATEPPRKRGRPTKLEAERRKAEAEARGVLYQPQSRQRGSQKAKAPSTPTSPSGVEAGGTVYTQTSNRPPLIPPPGLHYVHPPLRSMPLPGSSDEERMRTMPNQISPALRELPRPQETRQTLPSPHALQLGHRESIPRIEPGDRPYEPLPPERLTFTDSSRRSLVNPPPRPPDEPHTPDKQIPLTTTAEKRT